MKPSMRVRLLRILATTAVNVCVYAVAVTLRMALFRADGGLFSPVLFLFSVILANVAFMLFMADASVFTSRIANNKFFRFLAFMLNIKNGSFFTSAVVAWTIILIPVITTLLIYMQQGLLRAIFEIFPVMVAYIISLKHARLPSFLIMSKNTSYTGFLVLALCLEAPVIFDRLSPLRPWMFAAAYLFIFAYLIIKNQEDIDDNIYNKKHVEKSILPKNLRKVNAVTVSVVFLVIMLLFNLKKVVITLLDWSARFIFLIIRAIASLMERLPVKELVTEGGGQAEQGLPEIAAAPPSPFGNLVFNIIGRFVVLYLTYKALFYLVKWAPLLWHRIVNFFKRFFSIKKVGDIAEEADFVDETETIKPVSDKGVRRKAAKNAAMGIKDLKREKDPVKKIRLMYSIILRMLPAIGVTPGRTDTTMEIINKVSMMDAVSEELYPFTEVYNQVRYGDKKPDGDMMTDAQTHFGKAFSVMGKTSH